MAPNLQLSLGNINTEKTNESSSGKETATTTKDKITGGSISKTSNPFAYSPKPTYKAVENYVSNPSTHNEEDDISNSLNKCNVKRRLNFNMGANTEGPTQSSFPKENPPDVHAAKAEEQRLSIPVYPHRMTRFLHEELKWIADQQEMLQAREKIINAFLSSLLWDSAAPAGPSHHHADSSASNPGYTPLAPGDTTKSRVA
nr:hypothetical protein Iba_chr04eCG17440 [Ipomoea batatas]